MTTTHARTSLHRNAPPSGWRARKALLKKEKGAHASARFACRGAPGVAVGFTSKRIMSSTLPAERNRLPIFSTARSQLAVYHFMFGPDWAEGCPSCSMVADGFDGSIVHIAQRDVSFAAISRARRPAEDRSLQAADGAGAFPWVSSHDTSFNRDFRVTFTKEELAAGNCYKLWHRQSPRRRSARPQAFLLRMNRELSSHTYSSFGRGVEDILPVYHIPRSRTQGTQ